MSTGRRPVDLGGMDVGASAPGDRRRTPVPPISTRATRSSDSWTSSPARPRAGRSPRPARPGQAHLGATGPLIGRLYEFQRQRSGSTLSAQAMRMRSVEPEFAFIFGGPRGGSAQLSSDDVLGAVASLVLAIEVPDSRFDDFGSVGIASLVADAMCGGHFLPRAPDRRLARARPRRPGGAAAGRRRRALSGARRERDGRPARRAGVDGQRGDRPRLVAERRRCRADRRRRAADADRSPATPCWPSSAGSVTWRWRSADGGGRAAQTARSAWACSSPDSTRPSCRPPRRCATTSSRSRSRASWGSTRYGPDSISCRTRSRCSRACRCWRGWPPRPRG